MASQSVNSQSDADSGDSQMYNVPLQIEFSAGELDLRGFEIARSEFFDSARQEYITFANKSMKLSSACVKKFGAKNTIELLVHPLEKKFAVRPTSKENRNRIVISKYGGAGYVPKQISTAAFSDTIFRIMSWKNEYRYRILGSLYENGDEIAYIFDAADSQAYFKSNILSNSESIEGTSIQPITSTGHLIRAIPEEWTSSFGKPFYLHEQSLSSLAKQSQSEWKLRMEGQLFETGTSIKVTSFDTLRDYIKQELSSAFEQEE